MRNCNLYVRKRIFYYDLQDQKGLISLRTQILQIWLPHLKAQYRVIELQAQSNALCGSNLSLSDINVRIKLIAILKCLFLFIGNKWTVDH